MKRIGFLASMLGWMLFASHAHALPALPPGAIVSVVCPGGYGYNGQTGLITNVVIRNTAPPKPAVSRSITATSAPNTALRLPLSLISFTYPSFRGAPPCRVLSLYVHIEEGCAPELALSIGVYVPILRHL